MDIKRASEISVVVYFEKNEQQWLPYFCKKCTLQLQYKIWDIIPAYNSVLICYDVRKIDFSTLQKEIQHIFSLCQVVFDATKENFIEIPICYDERLGWDQYSIIKKNNITREELIYKHSIRVYDVQAVGFTPGFGYLGEVDETIRMPRLPIPRKKIPALSVAIAERQTCIYPLQSPGGWNIIGKTYKQMFNKTQEPPCLLKVGDKVKFYAISFEQFIKHGGKE